MPNMVCRMTNLSKSTLIVKNNRDRKPELVSIVAERGIHAEITLYCINDRINVNHEHGRCGRLMTGPRY